MDLWIASAIALPCLQRYESPAVSTFDILEETDGRKAVLLREVGQLFSGIWRH